MEKVFEDIGGGIIRINTTVTDFHAKAACPTFVYFNSRSTTEHFFIQHPKSTKLWESISDRWIEAWVMMKSGAVLVVVEVPENEKPYKKGKQLWAGSTCVDYDVE